MSCRKQKGSGRAKHVFTQSGILQQKAVGSPELEKELPESVPAAGKSPAESASEVRLGNLPIPSDFIRHSEKYIDRYMEELQDKKPSSLAMTDDMEDADDGRVTVVPDRFALEAGLSGSALSREWDMQRYHCFALNNVKPEALTRLLKNTKCLKEAKTLGMVQFFEFDFDGTSVILMVDRYSDTINVTGREGMSPDFDDDVRSIVNYLAEADIIRDYQKECKVALKDMADSDMLEGSSPLYPALWISGAGPEHIRYAKSLHSWYKGMVQVFITPSNRNQSETVLHIRNILGGSSTYDFRLGNIEPERAILLAKSLMDADRFYRSSSNLKDILNAYNIDSSLIREDGFDITKIPLFRKVTTPEDEQMLLSPFIIDPEEIEKLLDGTYSESSMKDIKELNSIKEDLKKTKEEVEKWKGVSEEWKKTAEQNIKDYKEFGKKLDELETKTQSTYSEQEQRYEQVLAEKKELEDKLAEYAGLLRDQKDTDEYEQILKASEDENAELKKKCAELEAANEALKQNFETIKRKDVRGEALITRGSEKDFFIGEAKDFILSAIAKEIDACQPNSRRFHVLKDVLESNGYEHLLESKKNRLKAICREYDGNLNAALPELEKEGYYVKTMNGHPKIEYYGDSRYVSVVSRTPSDYSSGLNQISDMAVICL